MRDSADSDDYGVTRRGRKNRKFDEYEPAYATTRSAPCPGSQQKNAHDANRRPARRRPLVDLGSVGNFDYQRSIPTSIGHRWMRGCTRSMTLTTRPGCPSPPASP